MQTFITKNSRQYFFGTTIPLNLDRYKKVSKNVMRHIQPVLSLLHYRSHGANALFRQSR